MSALKGGMTQWGNFDRFYIPEPNSGCWLWIGSTDRKGYGQIRNPSTNKLMLTHRASYLMAHGTIPKDMHVLHRCDVPCCVNPDHLFTGTHVDNMLDMREKGRHRNGDLRGELHPQARMTPADIQAIRSSSGSSKAVSAQYGVSSSLIRKIRERKLWRHIP